MKKKLIIAGLTTLAITAAAAGTFYAIGKTGVKLPVLSNNPDRTAALAEYSKQNPQPTASNNYNNNEYYMGLSSDDKKKYNDIMNDSRFNHDTSMFFDKKVSSQKKTVINNETLDLSYRFSYQKNQALGVTKLNDFDVYQEERVYLNQDNRVYSFDTDGNLSSFSKNGKSSSDKSQAIGIDAAGKIAEEYLKSNVKNGNGFKNNFSRESLGRYQFGYIRTIDKDITDIASVDTDFEGNVVFFCVHCANLDKVSEKDRESCRKLLEDYLKTRSDIKEYNIDCTSYQQFSNTVFVTFTVSCKDHVGASFCENFSCAVK